MSGPAYVRIDDYSESLCFDQTFFFMETSSPKCSDDQCEDKAEAASLNPNDGNAFSAFIYGVNEDFEVCQNDTKSTLHQITRSRGVAAQLQQNTDVSISSVAATCKHFVRVFRYFLF